MRRNEGVILVPGVGNGSATTHRDGSCSQTHWVDSELIQSETWDADPKTLDGGGASRYRRQAFGTRTFGTTTFGRPL